MDKLKGETMSLIKFFVAYKHREKKMDCIDCHMKNLTEIIFPLFEYFGKSYTHNKQMSLTHYQQEKQ